MLANKQHRHPAFIRFDQHLYRFHKQHPTLFYLTALGIVLIGFGLAQLIEFSIPHGAPMARLNDRSQTPAMQELYRLLLKSEKFLNWKPEPGHAWSKDPKEGPNPKFAAPENPKFDAPANPKFGAAEAHYTPDQLAELWGVSAETVRLTFRNEPGVLGCSSRQGKRQYVLMRIPLSVAERVHKRLSALPVMT